MRYCEENQNHWLSKRHDFLGSGRRFGVSGVFGICKLDNVYMTFPLFFYLALLGWACCDNFLQSSKKNYLDSSPSYRSTVWYLLFLVRHYLPLDVLQRRPERSC